MSEDSEAIGLAKIESVIYEATCAEREPVRRDLQRRGLQFWEVEEEKTRLCASVSIQTATRIIQEAEDLTLE